MQNETHPITVKTFLRTYNLIHLALVAGVFVSGFLIYMKTKVQELNLSYSGDVMFFVVPIMAISGIVAGNFLYAKNIKKLDSKTTLLEKLNGFQTAAIIRYALLEGPALLGIVAFINDGNQYFLIISLNLLAWLIAQRPTRDKVERELKLEGLLKSEFQKVDKPLV